MNDAAADALLSVLVFDGHVPLGLHTSPLLANAVCLDLDDALAGLVPGGVYTRYADDLSFSGPQVPFETEVRDVLAGFGFQLADEKWAMAYRGRGLYVTGLSLEDQVQPRVPRKLKRRIRQELHYAKKYGLTAHIGWRGYGSIQQGVNKMHGTIQFIRGIEGRCGGRFQDQWQEIAGGPHALVSYLSTRERSPRQVLFLVDESQLKDAGCLVLCLVVVEDAPLVGSALSQLLDDILASPDSTTPKDVLRAEGLHWNTLVPDDRSLAVRTLRSIPFRAFVAFATLPDENPVTYTNTYQRLLETLVEKRLLKYDGASVEVLAEENTKVASGIVEAVVAGTYSRLEAADSRRPNVTPGVRVVAKQTDPCLPLPDLILGVFGDYARVEIVAARAAKRQASQGALERQLPGAQAKARFEQLQDKVRLIRDVDADLSYSRRRSFQPWTP